MALWQQLKTMIQGRVQTNRLLVGGFALFFVFLGMIFLQRTPSTQEITPLDEELVLISSDISSSQEEPSWIYVDIKGEVTAPGVYQVDVDCRLMELIDKAGGLTAQADEQKINLAQKLTDQALVIIPTIATNEEKEIKTENQEVLTTIVQSTMTSEGKININTAGVEELTELSGIGVKKAQQIIEYREMNGSFKTVEDLVNVSGIGEKTVDKLKDEVCVQ